MGPRSHIDGAGPAVRSVSVNRPTTVLLVGAGQTASSHLRSVLDAECVVREVITAEDARREARPAEVDCVVVAEPLPDDDARALLVELRARRLGAVVVADALPDARVVELLRAGAADVWTRAASDPPALEAAVAAAIRQTTTDRADLLRLRIWERMPLGVMVLEVRDGYGLRVTFENDRARSARLQAPHGAELVAGVDTHTLNEVCGQVLLGGEPVRLESEPPGDPHDGPVFHVHLSRLDTRSVLLLLEDVTELQRARRQLEAASRMEAIGRLAGGVAHDFNNMLTVISGHAGFIREATATTDPCHDDAAAIMDAASRSAELTRQLLGFSRRQIRAPRVLDLNATIASLQPLLRRIIGEHIAVEITLDPAAGSIMADPTQVEQVLMNLSVNARDAMPDGGALSVGTSLRTVREALRPGSFVVEPGTYAELRVVDRGQGMSPETMARMFEPFFTTKSSDEGTGLGLATVYGIVKQSNGYVWAESTIGRGSTFRVLFPRVDATPTAIPPSLDRHSLPGGETVLLVEDDRLVRRAVRRILENHGYRVLEADLPSTALDATLAHDGPLDIILTDLVMPEMSGRELVRRLADHRPDTRVIFTSGYSPDEVGHADRVVPAGLPFIAKPFSRQTLIEALHDALCTGPTLASIEWPSEAGAT